MDSLETSGGEAGGEQSLEAVPKLLLKRSELLTLRKMADRYPYTEGERREVCDVTMDLVRNAKSQRLKIGALRVQSVHDEQSRKEVEMYLKAIGAIAQHTPDVSVNNNVVIQVVENVVERQPSANGNGKHE